MSSGHHESFAARHRVKSGSARSFGLVFAGFFLLFALGPLFSGRHARGWALALAVTLLAVAMLRPALLTPFNRLWQELGVQSQRVMNPLMIGVMFFGIVTPFAFVMRAFGKDPLGLHFERSRASYWVERTPPGPPPSTMRHQF